VLGTRLTPTDCDLLELRLDALGDGPEVRTFAENHGRHLPILITARHPDEGGVHDLSVGVRARLLKSNILSNSTAVIPNSILLRPYFDTISLTPWDHTDSPAEATCLIKTPPVSIYFSITLSPCTSTLPKARAKKQRAATFLQPSPHLPTRERRNRY
jgi:hypothetical protein